MTLEDDIRELFMKSYSYQEILVVLNIEKNIQIRDKVLHLMHAIDPDGVEMRTRHCLSRRQYSNPGPNFLIHIDGYNKLKRYGFAIHGAVFGFSRRVLWLTVGRTNNDPAVVASFYLKFVKEIEVPRCIRTDAGTENVMIHDMQQALRWYDEDEQQGEKSVIISISTTNQVNSRPLENILGRRKVFISGFSNDFSSPEHEVLKVPETTSFQWNMRKLKH